MGMTLKNILYSALAIAGIYATTTIGTGCAQIGAPTGGPRDSIAPVLVSAAPKLLSTNFTGKTINLVFDEYINVNDVQKNVLVSPFPKTFPVINYKLKTVSIKLIDTLLANTTYAINFGNAIVDNNEANPLNDFTYVFSTGNAIDSLILSGKVLVAETGKVDSSLQVLLYRNANDSSVQKRKPDFVARLNGQGQFQFKYLAAGTYHLYALNDGDGSRTYNSPLEVFAFADSSIQVGAVADTSTILYAYATEKETKKIPTVAAKPGDKKLQYLVKVNSILPQDLLEPLELAFNNRIKITDSTKILLTDTNYYPIAKSTISLDSTRKIIRIKNDWPPETAYRLIINKAAVSDSLNNQLAKTDTLRFVTKKEKDYGSLKLRFANINLSLHPVIQFLSNGTILRTARIEANTWSDKRMVPGEYELRILYDTNNNGQWDPGNYRKKQQPEKAITLDKALTIKANWDNERDVEW